MPTTEAAEDVPLPCPKTARELLWVWQLYRFPVPSSAGETQPTVATFLTNMLKEHSLEGGRGWVNGSLSGMMGKSGLPVA